MPKVLDVKGNKVVGWRPSAGSGPRIINKARNQDGCGATEKPARIRPRVEPLKRNVVAIRPPFHSAGVPVCRDPTNFGPGLSNDSAGTFSSFLSVFGQFREEFNFVCIKLGSSFGNGCISSLLFLLDFKFSR